MAQTYGLQTDSVVVFGAARGIGLSIARAFADEGSAVTGIDINAPDSFGSNDSAGQIEFLPGDATELGDVQRVADACQDARHIVYAVGVGSGVPGFPFWNQRPSDWGRVLDVNLMGAVNVAHVFGPRLAKQRAGTFLFLVSVAGQVGSQTDPPYSAAKAALINFTQCMARDLAEFDVRANAISPGMVKTALNESVWKANQQLIPADQRQTYEEWAGEKVKRIAPLGRWQTPDDMAAMALFLASDLAKNITGQTINVDGGQVMHS